MVLLAIRVPIAGLETLESIQSVVYKGLAKTLGSCRPVANRLLAAESEERFWPRRKNFVHQAFCRGPTGSPAC